ncbi:octanoyltransferase [Aquibacillus halophilus]|uniref:Octanoyl-[GcvH]:protein N-octanoyltransferase n=1 Tax=Aquibacillus halophilus TaxID=930132 RepID=A0A6A8DE76_9BACI|nr:lipoate--protein ligase family protein [Aquibacillus halophilus]MRH44008.1 octanoyltransferase [Aquibacillus halophilus]
MSNFKRLIKGSTLRYIDQTDSKSFDFAMASFAIDDALSISVGNTESPPTVRLWVHEKTVVLGIADAKLPNMREAVAWLQQQGYRTVVRNSGGLAVVLDSGVLNISLILPDNQRLGIHEGYEMMVDFIQEIFSDLTSEIKAFEVKGSYCPGEYDLSIGGKKFAGISQRRVKHGVAVQIYLCVEGDGIKRAELIEEFYKIGTLGEKGRFDYPTIQPKTMASLTQLLDNQLTIDDVKDRIKHALKQLNSSIQIDGWSEQEEMTYQKRLEQMVDRNEKALGDLS